MIYDATDPDQLSESDAWQVRLAFAGKDRDARIKAIRRLWSTSKRSAAGRGIPGLGRTGGDTDRAGP